MRRTLNDLGRTERLQVRCPQEREIDQIVELWTDARAMYYVGGPREPGPVAEHFRACAHDPAAVLQEEGDRWWSVELSATGEFIGLCALLAKQIDDEAEVELNYFFLPSAWGHGYATEASRLVIAYAFQELDLDSLVAIINPDNAPSAAVADKLGMMLEKETVRADGSAKLIYRLHNDRSGQNR